MRNDLTSFEDSLEHLWIEVKAKNKKSPWLFQKQSSRCVATLVAFALVILVTKVALQLY